MASVSNLASSHYLLDILQRTQSRTYELQAQIASQKVSDTYTGVAKDTGYLLNLETSTTVLEGFVRTNELMENRIDAIETTVEGVQGTIEDFRTLLINAADQTPLDEATVADLQSAAFTSMLSIEAFLNADLDGGYLFSGSQSTTKPVDLGFSSLEEFQAVYDGSSVVYPPTREAQVGSTVSLSSAATGGLTMTGGDTITATTAGAFTNLNVGATITLSDSTNGNDGTYTVVSKTADNSTITIAGTLTVGTPAVTVGTVTNSVTNGADTATIDVRNWYQGDNVSQTHRVDTTQSFDFDLNAADPAFEKAIRAMGIIAQGAYGDAGGGGLEANTDRISDAIHLLNSALDRVGDGVEPYGEEESGSLEEVSVEIGFQQVMLSEANTLHSDYIASLQERAGEIENVDQLEAVSSLMSYSRALEASYEAIARIQDLSLLNYLS